MAINKNTSKYCETRLSGSGGQGLILAGIILAKGAIKDGLKVSQSQSYGPESRGGSSRADVIINNDMIYYPEATHFDILLSLNQESCDKYIYDLKPEGVLIVDTTFAKNISVMDSKVYEVPFTKLATEKIGSVVTTNILALSFLVKITKIIPEKSLEEAIKESVKPAFYELNMKAMKLGFELAENYK